MSGHSSVSQPPFVTSQQSLPSGSEFTLATIPATFFLLAIGLDHCKTRGNKESPIELWTLGVKCLAASH
ncbi:hypothetical protein J6590_079398 [Homalodisca vitripennis]|nr:hypothetical protein J6590_079398 [Homalodisca vitripennis]